MIKINVERQALDHKMGDFFPMFKEIYEYAQKVGITLPKNCDHICYRVETLAQYEEYKSFLATISTLSGEEIVNGRPISIFSFIPALETYNNFKIDCVELPSPKEGSKYKLGWEHAEFVTDSLNTLANTYPQLDFKTSGMNKELNPELALKVSDDYQMKFHPIHILDVLEIEKRQKKS